MDSPRDVSGPPDEAGPGAPKPEEILEYSVIIRDYFRLKNSLREAETRLDQADKQVGLLRSALFPGGAPMALLSKSLEVIAASLKMEEAAGGAEGLKKAVEKLTPKIYEAESLGREIPFEILAPTGEGSPNVHLKGWVGPLWGELNKLGYMIRLSPQGPAHAATPAPGAQEAEPLVETIHDLQAAFIGDAPAGELFKKLLDRLLALTGSKFGFVGRTLVAPDGKRYLKTHAITDISWNDATRALFQRISNEGLEFRNPNTLFGHCLKTGEIVISNNPKEDPRSGGLPDGHPPIDAFLGVPFTLGGRMVGMAGLANRPGGYGEKDVEFLRPLLSTCASLVDAYENKEKRRQAEENLILARQAAEKAIQDKDKYISLIAHDLKSPFTSIIAFLKLLGKGKVSLLDPDNRPLFDSIIESSERAAGMIDEVLSLSRLGMGAIKLRPRFIDARTSAFSAISLLGHMAQGKKIEIINDIPPGSRIHADSALFGEVLNNLLSNAIKFSARGSKVAFFIPSGQPGTVAVRDNGVGIDDELLPLLFRHDIKTTTEGTEGEKGTGLALPLCKEIMRAHHGDLAVESVKGKGSVFYARLQKKKPAVMIVDDEKMARDGIHRLLEKADVDIVEVDNAHDCMSRAVAAPPDLLCLDLNMPGEDGFIVLEALKRSPDTAEIPIMVITSDRRMETRERAIRMGVDDFITKEALSRELLTRVRKFVV